MYGNTTGFPPFLDIYTALYAAYISACPYLGLTHVCSTYTRVRLTQNTFPLDCTECLVMFVHWRMNPRHDMFCVDYNKIFKCIH